MELDQATIQALLDAGIELVYQFESPVGGGCASFDNASDVMDLLRYGADTYATYHFGFEDPETYREWLATGGVPLCGATTKQGKLCANSAAPFTRSAEHWLELHRIGRCTQHQGK